MAVSTKISTAANTAAINAACDAITALLNTGGAGIVRIYDDTAARPANVNTAVPGTSVLLAELVLPSPAFGSATDGVATANPVTDDVDANATGTALWFRAFNGAGAAVIDGNVGAGTYDMNINTTAIVEHLKVSITSWTFTVTGP